MGLLQEMIGSPGVDLVRKHALVVIASIATELCDTSLMPRVGSNRNRTAPPNLQMPSPPPPLAYLPKVLLVDSMNREPRIRQDQICTVHCDPLPGPGFLTGHTGLGGEVRRAQVIKLLIPC